MKKLLCERNESKLYLEDGKYIMVKELEGGKVETVATYDVKDWYLCPLDCYERFGYKIVDMDYLSKIYDERRLNPEKFKQK